MTPDEWRRFTRDHEEESEAQLRDGPGFGLARGCGCLLGTLINFGVFTVLVWLALVLLGRA